VEGSVSRGCCILDGFLVGLVQMHLILLISLAILSGFLFKTQILINYFFKKKKRLHVSFG
jgi:hypothetical protein